MLIAMAMLVPVGEATSPTPDAKVNSGTDDVRWAFAVKGKLLERLADLPRPSIGGSPPER